MPLTPITPVNKVACVNEIVNNPDMKSMTGPSLIYIETLLDEKLSVPALLDNGAAVNLISLQLVEKLDKLQEVTESNTVTDLVSFTGETTAPYGEVKLSLRIGK